MFTLPLGIMTIISPTASGLIFPDNVHIRTSESIETHYHMLPNKEVVAISSFSYTQPWINENKALDFPRRRPQESHYHIGMYHGDVGQQVDTHRTQQYAPTRLSDLLSLNYDYRALGHIHVPTVLKISRPLFMLWDTTRT